MLNQQNQEIIFGKRPKNSKKTISKDFCIY